MGTKALPIRHKFLKASISIERKIICAILEKSITSTESFAKSLPEKRLKSERKRR